MQSHASNFILTESRFLTGKLFFKERKREREKEFVQNAFQENIDGCKKTET